jgi:hypothetical protein
LAVTIVCVCVWSCAPFAPRLPEAQSIGVLGSRAGKELCAQAQ